MAKTTAIKNLTVDMPLKNKGVEIQVNEGGRQFGDIYVAKTGIVWCSGKTHRKSGVNIDFETLAKIAANLDDVKTLLKKLK